MSPAELVECLALIGGQHGIGQTVVSAQGRQVLYDAPAATVLQIAASVAGQHATADVCLKLADGSSKIDGVVHAATAGVTNFPAASITYANTLDLE
jgi:hypothetical protein